MTVVAVAVVAIYVLNSAFVAVEPRVVALSKALIMAGLQRKCEMCNSVLKIVLKFGLNFVLKKSNETDLICCEVFKFF